MALTVYLAKQVLTVDADNAIAEAVAVEDGFIVGVGSAAELTQLPGAVVDESFVDKVITPGFIEAHAHTLEGALWHFVYCGRFGRFDPEGTFWPDCETVDQVLDRLREANEAVGEDETLLAWGFDPIYYPGKRLTAHDLDAVSSERPIFLFHASAHIATVNTALLNEAGITPDTDMEGVLKDADGWPLGELQEPPCDGNGRHGHARNVWRDVQPGFDLELCAFGS